MDDLEIRVMRKGDEEKIVELLDLVFQGWSKISYKGSPVDHFEWKIKDNPVELVNLAVCYSGSQLVGCLADYPRTVKLGSEYVKCGCFVDAAVHPSFRGKGIYSRMDKLCREEMSKAGEKIFNGVGGNPILMDMTKRRGDEDFPAEVLILVRIHYIELHARKKNRDFSALEKLGYKGLQTISKLGLLRGKPPSPEDLRLKTVDRFESDIDEFWDRVKDGYQFALKRDSQFLNWRFCDQRNGSHRITIAYIQEEIAGYCVTRINKYIPDYPEGYIVDLMTLSDRSDVAELLLSDATNYFDENQVNIGYYMGIKNRTETRILNTLGYIDSRSGFGVSLQVINPYYVDVVEKLKTVDPSNVDYQFAHTDWI